MMVALRPSFLLAGPEKRWSTVRTFLPEGGAPLRGADGGAGGAAAPPARLPECRSFADTGPGGSVGGCCLGAWVAADIDLHGVEDIGGG